MGAVLFDNVNVFDGRSEELLEGVSVLVRGNRIERIGRDVLPQAGTEVLHGEGRTLMPGLIDCHVHVCLGAEADPLAMVREPKGMVVIKAVNFLSKYVDAGFTSLRDMGGVDYFDVALKLAVSRGMIRGPRLFVSGKMISETGGHGDFYTPWGVSMDTGFSRIADGVWEVVKAVREQIRAGADWIKICTTGGVLSPADDPRHSQFSVEEIEAIVREAATKGRRVASHAQGLEGVRNAVRGGVASVEHGVFLDDEVIEEMRERGVYLVPTLSAPDAIIKHGTAGGIPDYGVRKAREVMEVHRKSFRRAYEAGVRIAMGTDAGTPFNFHGSNAREISLMVESGMKPVDALRAATSTAAELLGIADRTGTVEEGKLADLILVDGDPIRDVGILSDPSNVLLVMKEGEVLKNTLGAED